MDLSGSNGRESRRGVGIPEQFRDFHVRKGAWHDGFFHS